MGNAQSLSVPVDCPLVKNPWTETPQVVRGCNPSLFLLSFEGLSIVELLDNFDGLVSLVTPSILLVLGYVGPVRGRLPGCGRLSHVPGPKTPTRQPHQRESTWDEDSGYRRWSE